MSDMKFLQKFFNALSISVYNFWDGYSLLATPLFVDMP